MLEYNIDLEHALEDYLVVDANIFYGVNEIKDFKSKALIWLPTNPNHQPYVYLLLDEYRVYKALTTLSRISLKVSSFSDKTLLILKNLRLTDGDFDVTGTGKGYLKLHHPRFIVEYPLFHKQQSKKFTFKISDSELLQSKIDLSGLEHLGIRSIRTDNIIEKNILHVETVEYVNTYYTFKKELEPVISLILNLTSFAERRRLTWSSFMCGEESLVEYYNCRKLFYNDEKVYRLISYEVFYDFLFNSLQNISKENILYFNKILTCINRSRNYPTDAKIIVLNTALEIILKKKFQKKNDNYKKNLIEEIGIVTFDLPDIKKLIDIRNDLTHGDDVSSRNQFFYVQKWQILLERLVLNELGWNDLSMTDVYYVKGHRVFGLV
ncbi:MAG: hypothetical protein PHO65_02785 [Sulfurovum sp.]|nr:hypothetical protein [Sulfurovum sp.]